MRLVIWYVRINLLNLCGPKIALHLCVGPYSMQDVPLHLSKVINASLAVRWSLKASHSAL